MARTVSLKFSLEEADRFLKGLEGMGKAGEDMAARLDKAARKAEASGQPIKKLGGAVDSLNSSFQSMAGRVPVIGGLLQGLGPAGTAAAVGIGALTAGIGFALSKAREAAVAFDALGESAKRVGVGVETLQELRVAATLSGVGVDALDNALAKLVRNQDKANQGSKETADQFARVGVTLDELRTLSPDELFRQMADGVAGLGTQAEKIGASEGLFGKGGSKLIETLDGGSAAIDRMAERARELGLVVGANVVADMGKLNDEIDIMQQAIDVNLKTAFSGFAPVLLDVAELAASLALGFREFIAQFREIENLGKFDLQNRQKSLKEEIANLERVAADSSITGAARGPGPIPFLENLAELDNELIKVESRLKELSKLEKPVIRVVDEDSPAQIKGAEDAAKKAEDAAKKLADEAKKRGDALRKQWDDELDYLLKSAQHNAELRKKDAERAALIPDFIQGLERQVELERMTADEKQIALEIDKARELLGLKINENLDAGVEAQIRANIEQLNGIEAAKKAAEESARAWERGTDRLKDSITDSIFRGFEDGESAAKVFFDTVKRTLLTSAIQIPVNFLVDTGAGLLRSALGQGGGSGGGPGALGMAGNAASIGNFLSGGSSLFGLGGAQGGIARLLSTGSFSSVGPIAPGVGSAIGAAAPYAAAAVAAVGILRGLGVFGGGKSVGPNAGGQLIESNGVFSVGPTGADNGGSTAGVIQELSSAVEVLNALASGIGVAQIGSGLASYIDTFKAGGIGNAADLIKDAISKGVIEGLTEAERALISSSGDVAATAARIIENRLLPQELAAARLQIEDPAKFARDAAKAERDGWLLRLAEIESGTQALADVEFIYQRKLADIQKQFAGGVGDTISDALGDAIEIAGLRLTAANDNLARAQAVLAKAVAAERDTVTKRFNEGLKASQKALDDLTGSAARIKSIVGSLKSALGGMDIPGNEGFARRAAQSQLAGFLEAARNGGVLPDQEALESVLRDLQKPSEALFNTFVDYQRDFVTTRNDISELANRAEWQAAKVDTQTDIVRQQIEQDRAAYDAEIARLDGILNNAQSQIEAVNGTTVAVVSVEQAVRDLIEALTTARSAGAAARAADPVGSAFTKLLGRAPDTAGRTHFEGALASGQSKLDVIQNVIRSNEFIDVNQAGGVAGLYKTLLGREADPEGLAFFNSALAQGQSLQKIALDITRNQEFIDNLPGFAHGGVHRGGLRVVGERGPELEFTGPSRIFSNSQSMAMLDNGAVVAELREVKSRLDRVDAALISIADKTATQEKLQRKWDTTGLLTRTS